MLKCLVNRQTISDTFSIVFAGSTMRFSDDNDGRVLGNSSGAVACYWLAAHYLCTSVWYHGREKCDQLLHEGTVHITKCYKHIHYNLLKHVFNYIIMYYTWPFDCLDTCKGTTVTICIFCIVRIDRIFHFLCITFPFSALETSLAL